MKRSELSAMLKELGETFDKELANMKLPGGKPGFTKKTREDLSAGFRDGARSVALELQKRNLLKIEED